MKTVSSDMSNFSLVTTILNGVLLSLANYLRLLRSLSSMESLHFISTGTGFCACTDTYVPYARDDLSC